MKKLNVKNRIINMLKENDESFFYVAPDIVGSVASANLDLGKNTFTTNFDTTDGRNLGLIVPAKTFQDWDEENDGNVKDFVLSFIKVSKPLEDDDEMLDEIVDEYGNLMGDEEEPANKNFVHVGKSKFSTDRAIKQTIPKSKRYYGDLGIGVITWISVLLLANQFLVCAIL